MPLFSPAPRSAFAHSRDDSDSSEEESSSSDEEEYLPPAIEHFNYPPLQAYRKKLIQTIIGPAYHLATTEGPDAVIEFWKLAEAMWIELFWFEENSFRIMDEHKVSTLVSCLFVWYLTTVFVQNYIRRKVREYKPADGDVIEVDAGNWRAELTTGDPKDHYTVVVSACSFTCAIPHS